MNRSLRREVGDLMLLAAGAIPGVLLRWQVDQRALELPAPWSILFQAALPANLLGCFLIGMLIVQPAGGARLYLLAGVGFCGSLTTFSSWMLAVARRMAAGDLLAAASTVLVSLLGGLLLVAAGAALGRRWLPDRSQGT